MAAKKDGNLKTIRDEPFRQNPKHLDGVPDLCMLQYMGEDNVLHNLNVRYQKKAIYTSVTAKVLIAVNPYMKMEYNYTEEIMAQYQAAPANLEGLLSEGDLSPHVFTVAHSAYNNLVHRMKNQSVIVCGESGSGKTESAKIFMRFLAFTSTSTSANPQEFKEAESIGKQVLDANPILETFGNAKTVLNNNSSRFGKFTKMLFNPVSGDNKRRQLVGAQIETYLLEKSRVVRQDHGERNYHVFYQLCQNAAKLPELKLGNPDMFHYLSQSGCVTIDGDAAEDIRSFDHLISAFNTLMIPTEQYMETFRIVAGILYLGNMKFVDKGQGCEITNIDVLEHLSGLFGVDKAGMEVRMKTRNMTIPGPKGSQTIVQQLNHEQAEFNRDSMSKGLYNGLFRWVVNRINQQSMRPESEETLWIGTLDVFGFEIFENNSFEQFCINFANERLQQYFNHHVLKAEQDLYRQEALLWDPIDLPDNQDVIDLVMAKPYGIMAILDSTCVQPKGDDKVFSQNLFQQHPWHPRLKKTDKVPQKSGKVGAKPGQFDSINGMTVKHYAGEVLYELKDFLVKNADSSSPDTIELFMTSKNQIAQVILTLTAQGEVDQDAVKKVKNKAFRSTGTVFSNQLVVLMETLDKTTPFFVRCIKPNRKQQPNNFEPDYVRPQLRCGGLVEALRIIKCGFPTRASYKRIHELFGSILNGYKTPVNLNRRDFAQAIILKCGGSEALNKADYQLGLTMVFFRPGKQSYLQAILDRSPADISKQKVEEIRKFLVYKRIVRMRGAIRGWLRLAHYLAKRRFQHAGEVMMYLGRSMGQALIHARASLNERKHKAEQEERMRDQKFQAALRAEADLKVMQQQRAEMDAKLTDWQKREEATRKQLAEQEAQTKTFMSKVQDLTSKYLEAQKGFENEKKAAAAQKAQIDELMSNLSKEGKTGQAALARLASMEQELQQSRAQAGKTAAELASTQTNKDETERHMQRELTSQRDLLEEVKRELEEARRGWGQRESEYEKKVMIGESKVNELTNQLRLTTDRNEASIKKAEESFASGQKDWKDKQDRYEDDLRRERESLQELKAAHTLAQKNWEGKGASLEQTLASKLDEISGLKRDISSLTDKLDMSKQSSDKQVTKLTEDLEKERASNRDRADKQGNELREKDSQLSDLRNQLGNLKSDVQRSKDQHEELSRLHGDKSATYEREKNEKDNLIAELRAEIKRLKEQLEELRRQKEELEKNLNEQLRKERNEARDKETRLEAQLREKELELGRVRNELELSKQQSEARLKSMEDSLKDTKGESSEARQRLEKLLSERDSQLMQTKSDLAMAKAEQETLKQTSGDASRNLAEQLNQQKEKARELEDNYERKYRKLEQQQSELRSELSQANEKAERERASAAQAGASHSDLRDRHDKTLADLNAQLEELKRELRAAQQRADQLRQQAEEKGRQDVQKLSDMKNEQREMQDKYERQILDKDNQLVQARHEAQSANDRFENSKTRGEQDTKGLAEQLRAEQDANTRSRTKFEQDLVERNNALNEAKQELRNEKRNIQQLQEKVQQQLQDKDRELDQLRIDAKTHKATGDSSVQNALNQVRDLNDALKRKENEFNRLKDDYTQRERDLESELKSLREQLLAARSKNDGEINMQRDSQSRLSAQLAEKSALLAALQKEMQSFRVQSQSEGLVQVTALQGQLQMLQALNHDLKSDKDSSRMREDKLRNDLRDANGKLGALETEVRAMKLASEGDLDRARNDFQTNNLKWQMEEKHWREEILALQTKFMAKESEASEFKSQIQNYIDKEHGLRESLRAQQMGVGDQMRGLQAQVNEMRIERQQWLDQKGKYERDFQQMAHTLQDVKHTLQQSQLKFSAEKEKLGTEVRALNSTLEQERAAWRVKENALVEELKGKSSSGESENANLRKQLEIVQVQAKSHMDAQAQAFKYRLQYLEMNQRNFHEEKKKWQDKEHLYEEKLNEMAYQINELKHEHQQAVNVHLSYKAHVESRLKQRESQDAIWQTKLDGLKAQSHNEKMNLEAQLKQLQGQLDLANRRYQKAEQDVHSLREQLTAAQAQASHFNPDPYGLQSPGFNASMGLTTPKSFMAGFGGGAGAGGLGSYGASLGMLKPMTPYGSAAAGGSPDTSKFAGGALPPFDRAPSSGLTPRASFAPKTPVGLNGVNGFSNGLTNGLASTPPSNLSVNVDTSSPRHSIHPEALPDVAAPLSSGGLFAAGSPSLAQRAFSPQAAVAASPHLDLGAGGDRLAFDPAQVPYDASMNGADYVNGVNGTANGYSPDAGAVPLSPSQQVPAVSVSES